MRRDRKNDEEEQINDSSNWMTTFSDMMTLLLTFFVMMYSMSVLDVDRFMGFISAFQDHLGVLEGGRTVSEEQYTARGSRGQDFNVAQQNVQRVQQQIQEFVSEQELEGNVETDMTDRGLVVRVTGEVLFELGRAEIQPEGAELLNEIIENIEDIPNEIMVEGHTDDWPISTDEFPSNWELSTARATNVVRYFVENTDIEAQRFSAAGYSEYRPLVPNDTVENRAQNRRVEIVVLNSIYSPEEEPMLEEIELEEEPEPVPGEGVELEEEPGDNF